MENAILDKETWEFINTFAPWLSAIGTLLAVGVSLYFARHDKRIRLEVNAGHRLIVTQGQKEPHPEYLLMRIVNIGHREAQITSIGWKVGLFKKQYAIQTTIQDGISSPLPVRLKDGEEAKYYIPLHGEYSWLEGFIKDFYQNHPKYRVKHTKIQVFTSVGKTFESTIEKGLQTRILEFIGKKRAM
jgi:hypothetical protein